jgi:hypothetical protein
MTRPKGPVLFEPDAFLEAFLKALIGKYVHDGLHGVMKGRS